MRITTKIFVTILILAVTKFVHAQHNTTHPIGSLNWDIIGMVRFKVISETEYYPVYSETVQRFEGSNFQLTGYMVPIKGGTKQDKFMLSTLPISQCFFCGKNGNPIMILVNLEQPVKLTFQPITVTGTLKLGTSNAASLPPVTLEAAKLSK